MNHELPEGVDRHAFDKHIQRVSEEQGVSPAAATKATLLMLADTNGRELPKALLRGIRDGEPWAGEFAVHYIRGLARVADQTGREVMRVHPELAMPEHTPAEREQMCSAVADVVRLLPLDQAQPEISQLLTTQYGYRADVANTIARGVASVFDPDKGD